MKKNFVCIIATYLMLFTACASGNINSSNSDLPAEDAISYIGNSTGVKSMDDASNNDFVDISTLQRAYGEEPERLSIGDLTDGLNFTTKLLPVNRNELHYEAMVRDKNPDSFEDELQYQAAINDKNIGAYALRVSDFAEGISSINASVFVDNDLISNQLYMDESAEVHFNIEQSFVGKTLKVLMSTSSIDGGTVYTEIVRR